MRYLFQVGVAGCAFFEHEHGLVCVVALPVDGCIFHAMLCLVLAVGVFLVTELVISMTFHVCLLCTLFVAGSWNVSHPFSILSAEWY